MKSTLLKIKLLVITLLVSFVGFAQPDPDGGDEFETPINTYVIWLAMAGIVLAFGYYKKFKTVKQ